MGETEADPAFFMRPSPPQPPIFRVPLRFVPKPHLLGKESIAITGRDIPALSFPRALPPVGGRWRFGCHPLQPPRSFAAPLGFGGAPGRALGLGPAVRGRGATGAGAGGGLHGGGGPPRGASRCVQLQPGLPGGWREGNTGGISDNNGRRGRNCLVLPWGCHPHSPSAASHGGADWASLEAGLGCRDPSGNGTLHLGPASGTPQVPGHPQPQDHPQPHDHLQH